MRYPETDRLPDEERKHLPWLFSVASDAVGVSDAELKRLGVTRNTLRNWCSGSGMPTKTRAQELRRYFADRGVLVNLKQGTLRFDIAKAIEAGVKGKAPKR